eukprot:scaffold8556_cov286-Pinguiococcus_pyrenoidosus.AAC.16
MERAEAEFGAVLAPDARDDVPQLGTLSNRFSDSANDPRSRCQHHNRLERDSGQIHPSLLSLHQAIGQLWTGCQQLCPLGPSLHGGRCPACQEQPSFDLQSMARAQVNKGDGPPAPRRRLSSLAKGLLRGPQGHLADLFLHGKASDQRGIVNNLKDSGLDLDEGATLASAVIPDGSFSGDEAATFRRNHEERKAFVAEEMRKTQAILHGARAQVRKELRALEETKLEMMRAARAVPAAPGSRVNPLATLDLLDPKVWPRSAMGQGYRSDGRDMPLVNVDDRSGTGFIQPESEQSTSKFRGKMYEQLSRGSHGMTKEESTPKFKLK